VETARGVRMWETATGRLGQPLPGSKGCHELTLSADGHYVAGLRPPRGRLIVWDAEQGKQLGQLDDVPSGTVAVSPDGRTVVVAAGAATGGTLATAVSATKVFTLGSGKPPITLRGHDAVNVIRYSPDGSLDPRSGEVFAEVGQESVNARRDRDVHGPRSPLRDRERHRLALYDCTACGGEAELLARASRLRVRTQE
jgi:WD40 repeat protein